MPELVIILIVALIVIGPKKLPEMAKSLGRGYREFQKAMSGIKDGMDDIDNTINNDLNPDKEKESRPAGKS
ncbi:MAG: twin-arginine translocase TatA/TatE family subunit [Nitrospinota bacterium]